MSPRRQRRGATAVTVALTLSAFAGIAALVVDLGHAWNVRRQLQIVADASVHAAAMELNGSELGVQSAIAQAQYIAGLNGVDGVSYTLDESDVTLGIYDDATGTFTATTDPALVNSVRVDAHLADAGLGLGRIAFGTEHLGVTAHAIALRGPGDASTGDQDGPGLRNGHFDLDTTKAADCKKKASDPMPAYCYKTSKHTHEYDDVYNTTWVDLLGITEAGHVDLDEAITTTQKFKIVVGNADLSPGAWLVINGTTHMVAEYDDIALSSLPVYALSGTAGATTLTQFELHFNVDSIANCELHPTVTGSVRANTPGPEDEWRNGALTVQAVKMNADGSTGFSTNVSRSNGGVQGVAVPSTGMLWETTTFWHWDGDAYHQSGWQAEYDALVCSRPRLVE